MNPSKTGIYYLIDPRLVRLCSFNAQLASIGAASECIVSECNASVRKFPNEFRPRVCRQELVDCPQRTLSSIPPLTPNITKVPCTSCRTRRDLFEKDY